MVSDVINASRGSAASGSNGPPTDGDGGDDSDSAESWERELEREMTESNDLVHPGCQASVKTTLALEPSAPLVESETFTPL